MTNLTITKEEITMKSYRYLFPIIIGLGLIVIGLIEMDHSQSNGLNIVSLNDLFARMSGIIGIAMVAIEVGLNRN